MPGFGEPGRSGCAVPDCVMTYDLHGVRIYECAADEGNRLRSDRDALDLMGEAWHHKAAILAIPVERVDEDFFRLKTGVADVIVQKFVAYRVRVAMLGDISRYVEESSALRDFVVEANRGDYLWFLENVGELDQRLRAIRASRPESPAQSV
jgi:hypothetical protein